MDLRLLDLGYPTEVELMDTDHGSVTMGYHSLLEDVRYMLQVNIDTGMPLAVGTAPYGRVAFYNYTQGKSVLVQSVKAKALLNQQLPSGEASNQLCYTIDSRMKQYNYRYLPLFEVWDENDGMWQKGEAEENTFELDYIEEVLSDGTHDKLHDGGLLQHHQAGRPMKLAMKWHKGKSEYTAYFWFDDEGMRGVYDSCCGKDPEAKADFVVRIDAMKNKYELSLCGSELSEPRIIDEAAYQLIVFKNRFEYHRSDNYDQPRGAWIW